MPSAVRRVIMRTRLHLLFRFLPHTPTLKVLDLLIAAFDRDARSYLFNYAWWISRRFIPGHPTFVFRRSALKTKYKSLNLVADAPVSAKALCPGMPTPAMLSYEPVADQSVAEQGWSTRAEKN